MASKPKHPEFCDALDEVIRKHAAAFPGKTEEERQRAARHYAGTRLTNTSAHRKATKGKPAAGRTCTKCGKVIGDGEGEWHHPSADPNPDHVEPYHRRCHPGGPAEDRPGKKGTP